MSNHPCSYFAPLQDDDDLAGPMDVDDDEDEDEGSELESDAAGGQGTGRQEEQQQQEEEEEGDGDDAAAAGADVEMDSEDNREDGGAGSEEESSEQEEEQQQERPLVQVQQQQPQQPLQQQAQQQQAQQQAQQQSGKENGVPPAAQTKGEKLDSAAEAAVVARAKLLVQVAPPKGGAADPAFADFVLKLLQRLGYKADEVDTAEQQLMELADKAAAEGAAAVAAQMKLHQFNSGVLRRYQRVKDKIMPTRAFGSRLFKSLGQNVPQDVGQNVALESPEEVAEAEKGLKGWLEKYLLQVE